MPERSMPERTVDTWVALAIHAAFPEARVWDPTQAMKGRSWDRSFLPREAGRVFIFEDKGTTAVARTRKEPLQTHRIDIGPAQLDWYCDEVESASRIPVYYVLPRPPWNGAGSGPIPDQAACRTASDDGPFAQWAYVSRCTDLRRELACRRRRSIDTDQLPMPGGMTLEEFLQHVRHGKAGRWLSPDDEDALDDSAGEQPAEPEEVLEDSLAGSALAVFVPADCGRSRYSPGGLIK